MPQSHTGSQQWQSFEMRMRHRRVERCLLRASVAMEAGVLEDAGTYLDEARQLEPHNPDVEQLTARLSAAPSVQAPVIQAPAQALPAPARSAQVRSAPPHFGASRDTLATQAEPFALAEHRLFEPAIDFETGSVPSSRRWLTVAALLIAVSGTAGWYWARQATAPPADAIATSAPANAPRDSASASELASTISPAASDTAAAVTPPPAVTTSAPEPIATSGTPGRESGASAGSVAPTTLPLRGAGEPIEATAAASPAVPRPDATGASVAPGASTASVAATTSAAVNAAPAAPVVALPDVVAVNTPAPPPAPSTGVPLAGTSVDLGAAPAPPPAVAPAAAAPVAALPSESVQRASDDKMIRTALGRYEAAYNRRDASAAAAVWPTADQRGLSHAFDGLASLSVSLGRCDVRVSGAAAQATCDGTQRWTPKVGGGTQSAPRRWQFQLRNAGDHWVISQVLVK